MPLCIITLLRGGGFIGPWFDRGRHPVRPPGRGEPIGPERANQAHAERCGTRGSVRRAGAGRGAPALQVDA
jgi:hypothetical protein